MFATLFLFSLAFTPDDDARAALALAQAQSQIAVAPKLPQAVEEETAQTEDEINYAWSYRVAALENKHLVVFVGVRARPIAGTRGVWLDSLNDDATKRIILIKPGQLKSKAVWLSGATDQQIFEATGQAVSQPALPFVLPSDPFNRKNARPEVPGADSSRALPSVDMLTKGMTKYVPAKYTQQSFNRSGQGSNKIIHRSTLEEKWNVPGGLAGLRGWTSVLYRNKAHVNNWFGHVDPNDSPQIGVWGSEITHQRSYDDGAVFADILTNDKGQPFEVRLAEKIDGQWHRYIAFKDPDARPIGYTSPTRKECRACHVQAGSGGYGNAMIPGGDEVLSDPLTGLES